VTAVALALASSLAWGVADFGAGLASRRLTVLTVMAVSSAASLPVIAAVVLLRGGASLPAGSAALAALAALSGTIALAAFYRGLAVGAMSVVAPISSTAAVVPVVFGLALGERPGTLQGAGVAIALVGAVLVSREVGEAPGERPRRTSAGVGLALLAALGFGGFFVAIAAASQADPWAAILVQRTTGLALVLIAVAVFRPRLAVGAGMGGALAAVGVLDLTANLLFALASTHGLVSLVGLLGSLYPVVTVLLARGVLRERLGAVQWAGVAAALTGVAMISGG
jgi:drug/metabolite transporter (DMT)-like permease